MHINLAFYSWSKTLNVCLDKITLTKIKTLDLPPDKETAPLKPNSPTFYCLLASHIYSNAHPAKTNGCSPGSK
jgi:hypothetical protein